MRPARTARDFGVGLAVTALVLGAAETALRVGGWPPPIVLSAMRDPRFQKEHHAGTRPPWMEEDPELMWKWMPGQHVVERRDELGLVWGYRTNAEGFRGADLPSPPGRPLVLCAGDSVTAGYGVGDDDAYPTLLSRHLRQGPGGAHATVINAGVYGYSSEQGRKLLAHLVARFRPDVVVVEYGINDSARAAYPDAVLIADDGAVRRIQKALERTNLYRALRDPIVRLKIRRHAAQGRMGARVTPERYAENLRAITRLVRAEGARPVFVSPTSKWERGVKPHVVIAHPERILTAHEMHVYRNVMAAVAHEGQVPLVSLPLLEGLLPESQAHFPDWCHPDPEGLCLLAEQLAPLVAGALTRPGRAVGVGCTTRDAAETSRRTRTLPRSRSSPDTFSTRPMPLRPLPPGCGGRTAALTRQIARLGWRL